MFAVGDGASELTELAAFYESVGAVAEGAVVFWGAFETIGDDGGTIGDDTFTSTVGGVGGIACSTDVRGDAGDTLLISVA